MKQKLLIEGLRNYEFNLPNELLLFSRLQTKKILGISTSFLDLIPEEELKKTRIGKRIFYSYSSLDSYIKRNTGL